MHPRRVKSIFVTFILCFIFWQLLTMSLAPAELVSGVVICGVTAWFSSGFFVQDEADSFTLFKPKRIFMLLYFLFVVFMKEVLKANLSMARLVFSRTPITQQAIIKIPVRGITNYYALAVLGDCITLTPGTISLDYLEENGEYFLYVQWIDMQTDDPENAAAIIKGPMEDWIRRIWE